MLRERTARGIVAYLPKSQPSDLLAGSEKEILQDIREEHAIRIKGGQRLAQGPEVELLQELTAKLMARASREMVLFREHALAYAQMEGWKPHELGTSNVQTKRAVDQGKEELKAVCPRVQILLDMLEIDMRGIDADYAMREARRMDVVDAERGATTELLSANVAKVGQLLIDSGLPQLLNGEEFSVEDKRVTDVATKLTSAEMLRELSRASWLKVRLGRGSGATPIKTITTICKSLGLVIEKKRKRVNGSQPMWHYRISIPSRVS